MLTLSGHNQCQEDNGWRLLLCSRQSVPLMQSSIKWSNEAEHINVPAVKVQPVTNHVVNQQSGNQTYCYDIYREMVVEWSG